MNVDRKTKVIISELMAKEADATMRYSYFRNATSALPTFYATYHKLASHTILYGGKQIKHKQKNVEEEIKTIYVIFRQHLSNLCSFCTKLSFLYVVRFEILLHLLYSFNNHSKI